MGVNLEKQMLKLHSNVYRNVQSVWIEQDVLVPDVKPDVIKVIKVEAIPFVRNSEIVSDGVIRVTGETTYYILYKSEEEKVRSITITYPFNQNITNEYAKKGMSVRVTSSAKNIIYSVPNERKIMIKLELLFAYELSEIKDINMIKKVEGEDIETKTEINKFTNITGVSTEVIDIKEDIVVKDTLPQIGEILTVSANISNEDYKTSYNKILVKGDLLIKIVYLSEDDVKDIYNYSFSVPFTGMVEFENISDDSLFDVKYDLRNLEIIKSADSSNLLNISAEIGVNAVMYDEQEIEYVTDMYSTKSNLKFDTTKLAVLMNQETIKNDIIINETVGDLKGNYKIQDTNLNTESLITRVDTGNLYVDGVLKLDVMLENLDTKMIENKTYDINVNSKVALNRDIDPDTVNIKIGIKKEDIRISNEKIDASIILDVIVHLNNIENILMINDIEEEGLLDDEFYSMYMYIVKKGDTLWDIAKKYKTTVAKIANINNIENENLINIGQKLLIIR